MLVLVLENLGIESDLLFTLDIYYGKSKVFSEMIM